MKPTVFIQANDDYVPSVQLKLEDRSTIGLLKHEWNDKLTPSTNILHTTKRRTQPGKTGLPLDQLE